MKGTPIAVPWYDAESYAAIGAMLPASESNGSISFDAFLANTIRGEKQLKRDGFIPYRIPIDAAAVKAWCDANNKPVCRDSISAYAVFILGARLNRDERTN